MNNDMVKYIPGHVGDCVGEGEEVGVALAGAHCNSCLRAEPETTYLLS